MFAQLRSQHRYESARDFRNLALTTPLRRDCDISAASATLRTYSEIYSLSSRERYSLTALKRSQENS